jgi:SecD/SecF fusion protein
MRHLIRSTILVVAVLVVAAASIFPPEKNLRLGKDLAGGVTLVYSVRLDPGQAADDTMGRLIDVLKRRIDPGNQMDISIEAVGRDRLEITMPLATERVKRLRAEFEAELGRIEQSELDGPSFERLMGAPVEERAEQIERIAGQDAARLALLQDAAAAHDAYRQARARYDELVAQGADEAEIDAAADAAAEAGLAYDAAREAALATVITPEEVREVLQLSRRQVEKRDEQTRELVQLPSAFDRAWEVLYERAGLAGEPDATDATPLQRQLTGVRTAYETYQVNRRTLDDPSDLKRLLQGAGVLEFRIATNPNEHPQESDLRRTLRERGPRNARARDAAWYQINRIEDWVDSAQDLRRVQEDAASYFRNRPGGGFVVEEYNGEFWMMLWDVRGKRLTAYEGDWQLASARQDQDPSSGRPAIGFRMDARGAQLLGELTGNHVNENMAVLLDDQVYTAPNINSRITSSGIITGDFTQQELRFLIQTLNAGSLQAKLSSAPISENTVGPELGQDNLDAGLRAGLVALVAVSAFMVFYYFGYGVVAVIALACTALIILGVMSLNRAAFTLPGIAGVILTFGMAVDANVLIYERIREELRAGQDLRSAVRLGYRHALSSIVDGNVTNLIVCVVLAYTGTQEIKGFAITLGIGVVATMFSALVVTRVIFTYLVEIFGIRRLGMLPTALPVIDRVLEPRVNWIGMRPLFIVISVCFVGLGVGMIASRGDRMLDTEFLGGTQVTLKFKTDEAGERLTMSRQDVQDRVMALAGGDPADPLFDLSRGTDVLPLNPRDDGVTSHEFKIKTLVTDQEELQGALATAFADVLDTRPPLRFAGSGAERAREAPVHAIANRTLGEVIGRPQYRDDISDYIGGVAIVLEDLSPASTAAQIRERIDQMRSQPDYSSTLGRRVAVRPLEWADQSAGLIRTAVVLVSDPDISFFEEPERWELEVEQTEWQLVVEALTRQTTLASVDNFSPAIASTFRAQAIVAVAMSFLLITIYIWVRFGSVRYSLAALVTLMHDVMVVLGLIALAEILYDHAATAAIAQKFGVKPFKIDLNLIAALLTIIGYSLNDTIIVMDRIRENRGKLDYASADVVNRSINQTISRTVITSGTTLVAVGIMYGFGGEGIRAFSYAMLIGIVVGTFSSIGVAAPMVWSKRGDRSRARELAEAAEPGPVS